MSVMSAKKRESLTISDLKEKRDLFFWTCEEILVLARKLLLVIFLAAAVAFAILAMFHGDLVLSSNLLR